MSIVKDSGGGVTFTGVDTGLYQLLVIRSRLKLEIAGGRSNSNTLKACKAIGFTGRTRKKALLWIEDAIETFKRAKRVDGEIQTN
tara:strand:- start:2460 stop:2714 length:255 start_codon:yes stop_codon:yes gene_type:complete